MAHDHSYDLTLNEVNIDDTLKPEMEIDKPADFTAPDVLYDRLIREIQSYHPSEDFSLIEKAYRMAGEAHGNQLRRSGEPYIVHPLNVALILAELELDKESIVAGLLHDVLEDTAMTYDQLVQEFGKEIAELVDGVTKLTKIDWGMDKEDIQAENLRKMFMAMARDIRVILVKLADRLHNMRTAQFWSPETAKEKARETMEIFSPIASRLGISAIKVELDDRSLAILEPEVFADLSRKLTLNAPQRDSFISDKKNELQAALEKAGIKNEIFGRVKHLFSIYKKMLQQNKAFEEIYDLFAIRILVNNVMECYAVLGVVHDMYTPLPGRFKDYIAMPKQNMYQSLHTTVMDRSGMPFEIQIRTFEMHKIAEYGIAAHWKYKEQGSVEAGKDEEEAKLQWLRSIMDWQTSDSREFVDLLKDDFDLYSNTVYCFTPRGEVKSLPAGSTAVDFAYAIHSAVGNRMVGAKVNGSLVPIEYQLQNGDRVEILTSQNSRGPSRDWLKIVRSSQAKNKINAWFRAQNKEENMQRGRDAFLNYCKSHGINAQELMKPELMKAVLKKYRYVDWDALMASVGHGGMKEGTIVNWMVEAEKKDKAGSMTDEDILKAIEENSKGHVRTSKYNRGIVVQGLHDLSVRFSRCCNPVPGDEIVGYITRGRGITIHRTDCQNIISLPPEEKVRLISADWSDEPDAGTLYGSSITIFCNNRIGMFAELTKIMTEEGIDIQAATSRVNKQGTATITMSFEIRSIEELNHLIGRLRQVSGVIDIQRSTGG